MVSQYYKLFPFADQQQTPFVQAMPEQYKDSDPVKAYRAYYIGDKVAFAKWNNKRNPPKWWRS